MKTIKGFQYHKSFFAIELEKKEFIVFTDRAFLPECGGTYHTSVIRKLAMVESKGGWELSIQLICGNRSVSCGLYKGPMGELVEFVARTNKLLKLDQHDIPPNV